MNLVVVSLFDGMSCDRLALDKIPYLNVLRYYSSEIKDYAIKLVSAKFPQDDLYRLGDITKVDGNKLLKEIREEFGEVPILLIGGSPCFVAGTKVITKEGYVNIEDVKIGMEVMTHTNKFQKVLDTGCKVSDTITIKAQGIKPTTTTKGHPYYVREMTRKWDNKSRKYVRTFSKPFWKEAGKLTKGDFIGLPINKENTNLLDLSEEECYILGRYIADGHTRKDYKSSGNRHWQLILSIGDAKVERFKNEIKENHFSCYSHAKSVHRVVFSNKKLVQIAEKYCGIGAYNKVIPQVFLDLPIELLKRVIDGYMDGDGSVQDGVFRATSISESLIMSLSLAVAKVYRTNSSYWYLERPKTTVIEGRTVSQKDNYITSFRKQVQKQNNAKLIDDIIWLPFKESINGKEELVFNLEVENDNSYTANNAIVHNCQDFSQANKVRLGAEGSKSSLFYEYIRIKDELNPSSPPLYSNLGNIMRG